LNSARVTVCIPTYDRAHFLHQALHSLCDQSLARHEYVVAISDNCSNDQTPDVVAEYRDRLQISYHRNPETVSHRENWGVVTALCETPYLAFLPDDDLLAPGQLGRALSAFDAHEGAVLVASLAVGQRYPGELGSHVRGMFLRATPQTSYSEPYLWDTTEWLALALVRPPLSLVGSVLQCEALRRCEIYKRYQLTGDRLLLAEMALHGDVLSLPWIGGYRRLGEHQIYRQSKDSHEHESDWATRDVLDLCEKQNLPVLEFWVDQVCLSTPTQRKRYLSWLRQALPSHMYAGIQDAIEAKSGTKPAARLDRWGIPRRLAGSLRAVYNYLR
jgi:glycosyltransferase involved in cell wall biosynthesis